MLSTNATSSIQRRRTVHRRQNSTPAAFEAPKLRQAPANTRQQRQQRSGMSLDLRGLNLETMQMSGHQAPLPDQIYPGYPGLMNTQPFQQEDPNVSITNLGQPPQHTMQVAHSHCQPQPGHQESFLQSPVQQHALPSPRTPRRTLRAQSPAQPPSSPSKAPSEQQLQELHQHIQSVYGSCGQVFINILPTPTATPHKPAQLPSHEPLDTAPMPPNFGEMTDINLEPTSSAMTFDFENPDADMGYESSSYYTSDTLSPSPMSSPQQKTMHTFLEKIEEYTHQEMAFAQAPPLLPAPSISDRMDTFSSEPMHQQTSSSFTEFEVDASIEYTGISAEEVQRYISEQDASTNKWTCLYPGCGKVFGRRENIRSHVQTHLGDRQYRCNGCGKCFVRQHDLKRHAKIHSGNKPYKCPCGSGFARQDALTRHRQRGMCPGGFPDAVRRQAKRGRPKKNRPDMDERVDKAGKTRRRALASAPSSVSAGSPSESYSGGESPSPLDNYEFSQVTELPKLLPEMASFGDGMSSATDPFSGFESASNNVIDLSNLKQESFASSSSFVSDVADMNNLLQQISQHSHTPPMSPTDDRPVSSSSSQDAKPFIQSTSQKGSSTPSRSSLQSNQFTTPPTSPVEPKDEMEELFISMQEGSCSQYDAMPSESACSQFDQAMSEFTSFDNSGFDLLDFTN
ncbi:hypothetical protein P154DRAFT_479107 [Amniculicola lignicola CBS 123094]|uniref:C2H2-type domain-containing protein n=1 Tax=Amniculicola lignicola CBS 123094 TaxID=1392246 RepID=A0A6A5X4F5_9PLEO|nr:hypothetical protein P154DRAFT_479107 [Amniculicola lignicola CBS 123094]